MHVILIPGFWLQGESWAPITPTLVAAGHHVLTPTLPGKESAAADQAGVGLRTHIERLKGENPEATVIIQADRDARAGLMVEAMDQARLAGVQDVSIAAQPR